MADHAIYALQLTHIAPGSKAYTWLEGDLASAAADKASGNIDWIIVLAHRPLYCSYHWSACCWDACDNQVNSSAWNNKYRDNVEPLLLKYVRSRVCLRLCVQCKLVGSFCGVTCD